MKKIFLLLTCILISNNQQLTSQPCPFFNQIANSPFSAETLPASVAFSPLIGANLFAAVANSQSSNVSVYTVNTSTGQFAQITSLGSPFIAGNEPFSVAFSPLIGTSTLFAAVANAGSSNVSVYTVNTSTGQFTQITKFGSPFATGIGPTSVAFSPLIGTSTLFAAITNESAGTVSVYTVSTTTGQFAEIKSLGSPFIAGNAPISVAFSPLIGTSTLFAAVANVGSNNVSVYTVNTSTGKFAQITSLGSPFIAGTAPVLVAFSPLIGTSTLFAAVANQNSSNVSVYTVNTSTGQFTQITNFGSPFPAENSPSSVAFSPLITANTLLAAVANDGSNNISVYTVDTIHGTFKQIPGSPFSTSQPFSVAFSPLITANTLFAAAANYEAGTASVFNALARAIISPTLQVTCPDQPINFNATIIGTGTFSYNWAGPNGFSENTGANPTLSIPSPTAANTGNYTVTASTTGCEVISPAVEVVVKSIAC